MVQGRSRSVLVTGGTGFVGSHLIKALVEKGLGLRIGRRDFPCEGTEPDLEQRNRLGNVLRKGTGVMLIVLGQKRRPKRPEQTQRDQHRTCAASHSEAHDTAASHGA